MHALHSSLASLEQREYRETRKAFYVNGPTVRNDYKRINELRLKQPKGKEAETKRKLLIPIQTMKAGTQRTTNVLNVSRPLAPRGESRSVYNH